jgi:apolipoprotein N-acyltransferase
MTWMGVPWLSSLFIAIFCWLFISFWGAILVTFWAILLKKLSEINWEKQPSIVNSLLIVFLGVAVWCGLEKLWSYTPLWWTSLSYTQSPHNLLILQLGKISGTTTITAAIVAVNGLIAESIFLVLSPKSPSKKAFLNEDDRRGYQLFLILPAVILFISLHLGGYWLYNQPLLHRENQAIKVGIIQGNIPNEIKLYPQGWHQAIEGYTLGYQTLAQQGVDVILTPETALPFSYEQIQSNSSFYQAILEEKVTTWLGAFGKSESNFTNSLFTITGAGKVVSRYDKIYLVPLGEYIPFANIFGEIIERLSPLDAHLIAGDKNQIFHTPFGKAIVGICYDSAFSEHFRRQTAAGGEFIITASNNAHYSPPMPAQHHAQDVMRAIETERWAARATNTGYSAIVDPHGRTLWISGLNTYELYAGTIYRRQTHTLYVRWGDWLTKFCLVCLVVYLLFVYLHNLDY